MPRRITTKDVVTLSLLDAHGAQVAHLSLPRAAYDAKKKTLRPFADVAYRRTHRVRFVRGRIYAKGDVVEEFVHGYDARGALIGKQSLKLDGLVLRTTAEAKTAMGKLIRGHQEAPPSFRRALVAFTKR
jgi:hypothetical protein